MQDWKKKKKQSSKALENASLEKKKTKFKSVGGECKSGKKKKKTKVKSLGKCYRCNLKKSGDGKDIIKKD